MAHHHKFMGQWHKTYTGLVIEIASIHIHKRRWHYLEYKKTITTTGQQDRNNYWTMLVKCSCISKHKQDICWNKTFQVPHIIDEASHWKFITLGWYQQVLNESVSGSGAQRVGPEIQAAAPDGSQAVHSQMALGPDGASLSQSVGAWLRVKTHLVYHHWVLLSLLFLTIPDYWWLISTHSPKVLFPVMCLFAGFCSRLLSQLAHAARSHLGDLGTSCSSGDNHCNMGGVLK